MERTISYENEKGQRGRITFTRTNHDVTIQAVELGSPTLEESTGEYVVRCECFGLVGSGRSGREAKDQLERIVRAHLQFILDRAGAPRLKGSSRPGSGVRTRGRQGRSTRIRRRSRSPSK